MDVTVIECDRFGNNRPIGRINFCAHLNNSIKAPIQSRLWRDVITNRNGTPMLPQWLALECVSQTTPP